MPTLLIGSRFKRPKAPIVLPNGPGQRDTTYFFKPRDPTDPTSEHVCVVENAAHQQRFMQIPEGYYIAEDEPKAEPIARPSAPAPTSAPPAEKVAAVVVDDTKPDAAAVAALLALPLKEFKKALATTPANTITAALAAENAKPEDDQRATYIKALEDQSSKA